MSLPVAPPTLGAWLQDQRSCGARTFACELLPVDGDTVRLVLLGMDRVAGANSAWEVTGNQIRPSEILPSDLEAIWET